MFETGEDEMGPSLQMALQNRVEIAARELAETAGQEARRRLLAAQAEVANFPHQDVLDRLRSLEEQLETLRNEVKGGRWGWTRNRSDRRCWTCFWLGARWWTPTAWSAEGSTGRTAWTSS